MSHALLSKEVAFALCLSLAACAPAADPERPSEPLDDSSVPTSGLSSRHPPASVARIAWSTDADAAVARARREGRGLLVYARADWNVASLELERNAWSDARVRRAAAPLVPLRIDVTDAGAGGEARLARFDLERVPSVLVLDQQGEVVGRLEGPASVEQVLALLAEASR